VRQQTLAAPGFEKHGRKSKRESYLDEMEQVVPWAELEALVEPHYPKGEAERPALWQGRLFGSDQGHIKGGVQYSCGLVGCHLRRKVVEFAVSHETHNPTMSSQSPPPVISGSSKGHEGTKA
jgi:hypothetical protein